jgi:hypothetical protein
MRRILTTTIVAGGALAASMGVALPASASAPPESTVPAEDSAPVGTEATAEMTPATSGPEATGSEPVVVVDEAGTAVAAISVASEERAWAGFAEGYEPTSGHEYLRVTVVVESRSPRGLVAVSDSDFIVQDADGFVTTAYAVPTPEEDAAEQAPLAQAELAEGETVELPLTFEVISGVAPEALYYQPSSDRLITVTRFG